MDEGMINLPAGAVTLGGERALRMAVTLAPSATPALVESPPVRASSMPVYSTPIGYDWRWNEPLAAAPVREDKQAA